MLARRTSDGSSERSIRASASPKRAIDVAMLADQVAGDAEPEEHVGPVEVGELRAFDQRARLLEQLQRVANLAVQHPGPRLTGEKP